jgi:hypothetical protein
VMKVVTPRVAGRAEGGRVAAAVQRAPGARPRKRFREARPARAKSISLPGSKI